MGVYEVVMQTKRYDVTNEINMDLVNDCRIHHVKPTFVLLVAKKTKLMRVSCLSEECARCCDATYDFKYKEEIVKVWNKWNPIEAPNDERSVAPDDSSEPQPPTTKE